MRFFKLYWFNLLIILLLFSGMGVTLLIAFSPKEDAQKRGFIPCTLQLAERVTNCHGQLWCTTKAVIKNAWCDTKIIGHGVFLWFSGEQPMPWSNYYFEPDLSNTNELIHKNAELFYTENPNYLQDFEDLKQEHKKLEENIENGKAEEN